MNLKGILQKQEMRKNGGKITAISDANKVLDTTTIHEDGSWELQVNEKPQTIIVQCKGACLAAVAVAPAEINDIGLPKLSTVSFELENYEKGIMLYADPVALDGFPDRLIDLLRIGKDDLVDLHVGEYSINSKKISIKVQHGRHRFSIARIDFHLTDVDSRNIALGSVMDIETGDIITAENGQVILSITDDINYKLNVIVN